MDREELGKAIWTDEYGLTQAGGAGAAATRTYGWSQFAMRMGTANAPNIPYSNLSVESGKYSRVFNDALAHGMPTSPVAVHSTSPKLRRS